MKTDYRVEVGQEGMDTFDREGPGLGAAGGSSVQKSLAELSAGFIDMDPEMMDEAISRALAIAGELAGLDRVNLLTFTSDEYRATITHSWLRPGVKATKLHRDYLSLEHFPWLLQKFHEQQVVLLSSLDDLPPEAGAEKKALRTGGITASLGVPLLSGERFLGYISFELAGRTRTWPAEQVSLLRLISDIVAGTLARSLDERWRRHLFELAVNLGRARSLGEAMGECLETALAMTELDCGGVYLVEEGSGDLRLAAHRGLSPEFVEHAAFHRADSPPARLIQDKQHIYTQYSRLGIPLNDVRRREKLLAYALIPLVFEDRLVACMSLASRFWHVVRPSDRRTIETIAAQAGACIARIQAEEKNRTAQRQLRTVIDQVPSQIFARDDEGRYLIVNESFASLHGKTPPEIEGRMAEEWGVEPETAKEQRANDRQVLASGQTFFIPEMEVTRLGGNKAWVQMTKIPYHHPGLERPAILAVTTDISARKEMEEALRENEKHLLFLSRHDKLTGLYNRYHFEELLQYEETRKQVPLWLIIADLDGLKMINDSYGCQVGDAMLAEAARLLGKICRGKAVPARWGGDEFAILLPAKSAREASALCRRIVAAGDRTFVHDLPLSLTLGMAGMITPEGDPFVTLREAEDNLFRRKLLESRSAKHAVLQTMRKTLAAKSYETEAHTERMRAVAQALGRVIGLSDDELSRLDLLITLHDIGKINIAEEILTKQGPLTEQEWAIIMTHPEVGCRIARASDEFRPVAEEILCHHEHWDGRGYPRGLRGEEIPLLARITALADAYEVMTNGRPYKPPMKPAAVRAEIARCTGTQFDPTLARLLIDLLDRGL